MAAPLYTLSEAAILNLFDYLPVLHRAVAYNTRSHISYVQTGSIKD